MEKQGSINKQGIKYHKRKIMLRRLKNRIRKNFRDILEILGLVAMALVLLGGFWGFSVLAILFFG